jgi:hypothetical protein
MQQLEDQGVVPVGAYVAPQDRRQLRELAHMRGVPVSQILREAIAEKLASDLPVARRTNRLIGAMRHF